MIIIISIPRQEKMSILKGTRSLTENKKTGLPAASPVLDFRFQLGVGVKVEIDPGVLAGVPSDSSVGTGVTRLTRTNKVCPG